MILPTLPSRSLAFGFAQFQTILNSTSDRDGWTKFVLPIRRFDTDCLFRQNPGTWSQKKPLPARFFYDCGIDGQESYNDVSLIH
jgi:hypothetical protein